MLSWAVCGRRDLRHGDVRGADHRAAQGTRARLRAGHDHRALAGWAGRDGLCGCTPRQGLQASADGPSRRDDLRPRPQRLPVRPTPPLPSHRHTCTLSPCLPTRRQPFFLRVGLGLLRRTCGCCSYLQLFFQACGCCKPVLKSIMFKGHPPDWQPQHLTDGAHLVVPDDFRSVGLSVRLAAAITATTTTITTTTSGALHGCRGGGGDFHEVNRSSENSKMLHVWGQAQGQVARTHNLTMMGSCVQRPRPHCHGPARCTRKPTAVTLRLDLNSAEHQCWPPMLGLTGPLQIPTLANQLFGLSTTRVINIPLTAAGPLVDRLGQSAQSAGLPVLLLRGSDDPIVHIEPIHVARYVAAFGPSLTSPDPLPQTAHVRTHHDRPMLCCLSAPRTHFSRTLAVILTPLDRRQCFFLEEPTAAHKQVLEFLVAHPAARGIAGGQSYALPEPKLDTLLRQSDASLAAPLIPSMTRT